MPLLREARLPVEELTPEAAAKRYPQIAFDGIRWALFEATAGYLLARRACETVLDRFRVEGGTYVQDRATPGPSPGGSLRSLTLAEAAAIEADAFVFACGPWLGQLFPDLLETKIRPTRQEVFFFGTPPGDRFADARLPVWIEHGARLFYGIPGNQWRGFKVADDTHGAAVDPTTIETMDRMPSAEGLADARALLARRFPELKGAPIVEARVCQYENSPDSNFIIDSHPSLSNVWIAGGGSGHGFKFGPALGERIAAIVLGERPTDRMSLTVRRLRALERGCGSASTMLVGLFDPVAVAEPQSAQVASRGARRRARDVPARAQSDAAAAAGAAGRAAPRPVAGAGAVRRGVRPVSSGSARRIDPKGLSHEDWLTREILRWEAEDLMETRFDALPFLVLAVLDADPGPAAGVRAAAGPAAGRTRAIPVAAQAVCGGHRADPRRARLTRSGPAFASRRPRSISRRSSLPPISKRSIAPSTSTRRARQVSPRPSARVVPRGDPDSARPARSGRRPRRSQTTTARPTARRRRQRSVSRSIPAATSPTPGW